MRKGEKRPDLYKARVTQCPVCKGEFRAVTDTYRRKQKYCSKECWANRNPKIEISCLFCSEVFLAYKGRKVYCNQECRDKHYRVRLAGENAHRWEGGKTHRNKILRSSAAFRAWRISVFERDKYTCVQCGAKSQKGRRVEIHPDHIKPLSSHPDLAFELSNGRTLCADCHKNTDTWGWKSRKYSGKTAQINSQNVT